MLSKVHRNTTVLFFYLFIFLFLKKMWEALSHILSEKKISPLDFWGFEKT